MPLYWVNVIVAFALTSATDNDHFWADAAIMGTATFNWTERLYVPFYNIVLWSLGIEIWFSVIFPALGGRAPLQIRTLLASALVVSLATRVLGEWHYRPVWEMNPVLNPIKDSWPVGSTSSSSAWRSPPPCGGYAPRARRGGRMRARPAGRLGIGSPLGPGAVVQLPRTVVPFINDLLLLGLFALVLGLLSVSARWKRAVTNAPLQVAGMMSYSLYLWHVLIVTRWFTTPADHRPFTYATYLLVTFGVAVLCYRYVEFRTTPVASSRPAAD
jgi:peptidoglycan/LPS O-acetylase OafA/YrhL